MFKIWPLIYLLLFLMLCNHLWNVMYEDYIYFVSDIAALCSLCPINLSSQLFIAFLAVMYVFNFSPLLYWIIQIICYLCSYDMWLKLIYICYLAACFCLHPREKFFIYFYYVHCWCLLCLFQKTMWIWWTIITCFYHRIKHV